MKVISRISKDKTAALLGPADDPKYIANVAEGFCPIAETHQHDDGRLTPIENGWLRCSAGLDFKLVE